MINHVKSGFFSVPTVVKLLTKSIDYHKIKDYQKVLSRISTAIGKLYPQSYAYFCTTPGWEFLTKTQSFRKNIKWVVDQYIRNEEIDISPVFQYFDLLSQSYQEKLLASLNKWEPGFDDSQVKKCFSSLLPKLCKQVGLPKIVKTYGHIFSSHFSSLYLQKF
jgi:hypothetical protein